ncbi:S-layer homology domain-containing protein [Paenibacillus endoradicis]|uniref:S-layer homology domain-containing protein n=1 Tax=Paenibacillus endoradicis TaxID=2972487 RepID=UPI002158D0AB|nr:S-layer homology domain-containing protein [Paenibacillus endoradicis]MCR8658681.1 S-layer homology domain-containing protein [Paenibacillus endoradicis]
MKKYIAIQKIVALLLVAVLTLPIVNINGAYAADGASTSSPVTKFDYFSAVYPHLNDENHILKTVTYEDLVTIFNSEGSYAILFGGAWSDETQADIGFINQVAKDYGIQTIYNFDTKLDGDELQIADSSNKYAHYYVDLVNKYLTNIETLNDVAEENVSYTKDNITTVANKLQAPFLFVYNKDHVVDGESSPIIASLEKHNNDESYEWSYFNTEENVVDTEKVDAYKAQVLDVFSEIPVANYSTLTSWEFIGNAFNQTFWSENPAYNPSNPTQNTKVTIFDKADGYYDVFEHVTYHQLTQILESDGNYLILFGGSWCPNTQADIKYIGKYAKEHNIDNIYIWDTKLTAGVDVASNLHPHNNDELQVRLNNHDYAKLYGDVVSQYLTNIKTQNNSATTPTVITYQDGSGNTVTADRLQVPYLFAYNKNNSYGEDLISAPILGHVELMYSLTSSTGSNIAPDYVFGGEIANGYNNKALAIALHSLYSRLEAIPTDLEGVSPTSVNGKNGKITGTTNKALEYKLAGSDDATYLPVDGDSITNLVAGTYSVRYRAKNGYQGPVTASRLPIAPVAVAYQAGQSVEVVVPAYEGSTPTPTPVTPRPTPETSETPTPTTPVDSDIDLKVEIQITATIDKDTGEAVAVVTEKSVQDLIDHAKKVEKLGESAVIVFNVAGNTGSGYTQLTLPRNAFKDLATSTDAVVQVNVGYGTVSFEAKAIDAIQASTDQGDISIIIEKSSLTEEGQQVLGDRPVYTFSVFAGKTSISSFGGGNVHISLPYTLQANEDPNAIIVYYIAESGDLETIRGQYHTSTKTVDFTTTHFSEYIIGYNRVSFTDVSQSAWYKDAVTFLAARNITSGTTVDQYSPNAEVTRGQFIVLLLKAYGIEADENVTNNFADAGNTYYTPYLSTAKRLGITTGIGDNKFDPNSKISRQDLFTLLYRALDVLGEVPTKSTNTSVSSFSDADQIAGYAKDVFNIFVDSGVIKGNNAKLDPKGISTRAEVAQVLYNLLYQ